MTAADFALLAGLVLAFGLVSKRIRGTAVTPPMIFVLVGLLLGPAATGLLHVELGEGPLHLLSELTLIIVLFGDATRIELAVLRREFGLPVRLLGIGLPLSIVVGAASAKLLLPELSWWEAATLGAILAPTDAALGQAVVSSPSVPLRIRQALNVESGLNDGIALPFVLVFASLASVGHHAGRTAQDWAIFAALQVTLGPLAGVTTAFIGGKLVQWAASRELIEEYFERLLGLAIALLCYAVAELIGGNGFIAAFVGGVTLGNGQRDRCEALLSFLESEGQLLMLLVFLGLGASLAPEAFAHATGWVVIYALISLTLVRMLPVSASLVGSKLRLPSYLFVGWFGPRGLASVLYGLLLLSHAQLPHRELVFTTIIVTALCSVALHGVSAAPAAGLYGRLAANATACPAEHKPVAEHPLRIRA